MNCERGLIRVFWHHRRNGMGGERRTNYRSVIGYRETAFAYAILAAGVAHNVARTCSMGRLVSCNCDPSSYKGKTPMDAKGVQWKWGGCSHNLDYGLEFSRQFLDTREKVGDIQSTVNLHNNQAGRLVSATLAILTSLNSGNEWLLMKRYKKKKYYVSRCFYFHFIVKLRI